MRKYDFAERMSLARRAWIEIDELIGLKDSISMSLARRAWIEMISETGDIDGAEMSLARRAWIEIDEYIKQVCDWIDVACA